MGKAKPGDFLIDVLNPLFFFVFACILFISMLPGIQILVFEDMIGLDGSLASFLSKKGIVGNKLMTVLFTITSIAKLALLIDDAYFIGDRFSEKNVLWKITYAKIFVQPLLLAVAYCPANIREADSTQKAFEDDSEMYSKPSIGFYNFIGRASSIIYLVTMIVTDTILETQLRNNFFCDPDIPSKITYPMIPGMILMYIIWAILHLICCMMRSRNVVVPKLLILITVSLEAGAYTSTLILSCLQSIRINSRIT